jgi:predicted nucleic acid-binding protein
LNVIDSSAWLEYFANGPNAEAFKGAVEDIERLVVPSVCVYEVFRRILKQRDERTALRRISNLLQGRVVDLDAELALTAARLGVEHGLPLADSIVYATARAHGATLWTQDSDFEGLEDVRYVARA